MSLNKTLDWQTLHYLEFFKKWNLKSIAKLAKAAKLLGLALLDLNKVDSFTVTFIPKLGFLASWKEMAPSD